MSDSPTEGVAGAFQEVAAYGATSDLDPATPQHLAFLVFLSYRHSQGGIGTQNRILQYIEANDHPMMFSGPNYSQLKIIARKMVGAYFLNPKTHPATPYAWEGDELEASLKTEKVVDAEVQDVFGRFEDRSHFATFESDPVSIAGSIIVMDGDYVSRSGGRGSGSKDLKIKVIDFPRDAYESQFIKYGILGAPTGASEYDDMFKAISSEVVIQQLDMFSLRELQKITDIYVKAHPEVEDDVRLMRLMLLCKELLSGK